MNKRVVLLILGIVILIGSAVPGIGFALSRGDVDHILKMAREGDEDAMVEAGILYYKGQGVLKDPFKAKCWVQKAHDLEAKKAETVWNDLKLWQYPGKCALSFDDSPGPDQSPGDIYEEPVTGMTFVWVKGRCFSMGTGAECPKGFWMGQYEVTQAQWQQFIPHNPSRFKGNDLPVEQVSYKEVKAFIQKMNQATGMRVSLPTEIQWEFACRDRGRQQPYAWGEEGFRPQANCGGCDAGQYRGRTAPVGSFLPNDLEIYDLGGNVREWCRKSRSSKDGNSSEQPVRGGSFVDNTDRSRCRAGGRFLPSMKAYYIGFRLVAKRLN